MFAKLTNAASANVERSSQYEYEEPVYVSFPVPNDESESDDNAYTLDIEGPSIDIYSGCESVCLSPHISSNSGEPSDGIYETDEGGRLVQQHRIGEGNYGVVFKGRYETADESVPVAIKRLHGTPSERESNDFEREREIMKRLDHPNVVKIITWVAGPELMIVMEFLPNHSLSNYLTARAMNVTREWLLKCAQGIASGMEYLKRMKIIHRDLAARNVLVEGDDRVKICDFGLAQIANAAGYYASKTIRKFPLCW